MVSRKQPSKSSSGSYETLDSLKPHLDVFIITYNFAKQLESLRWRTPFKPSVMPGRKTTIHSASIRTTSFRDYTPSISRISGNDFSLLNQLNSLRALGNR